MQIYRPDIFKEPKRSSKKLWLDKNENIDVNLVNAYLTRRALDFLVGFNLSPVLWRKLPGSKSAGRVQSVALRLITEREHEIELFNPEEFWTLSVNFNDNNLTTRCHIINENIPPINVLRFPKLFIKNLNYTPVTSKISNIFYKYIVYYIIY